MKGGVAVHIHGIIVMYDRQNPIKPGDYIQCIVHNNHIFTPIWNVCHDYNGIIIQTKYFIVKKKTYFSEIFVYHLRYIKSYHVGTERYP